MNSIEAYQILKNYIELDENTQNAYDTVISNQDEYKSIIKEFYQKTKLSIEMGQSLISLGELIKQFYNATHRQINNEIIDLPGSEFCKEIGEIANASIQQTIQINQITEEYAITQLSCNETIDISYS